MKTERPPATEVFQFLELISSTSPLQGITAKFGLIEIEQAVLPAFQKLRRGPGFLGGALRTTGPARLGSRVRACRR